MPDPLINAATYLEQSEQWLRLAAAADDAKLGDQYRRLALEYLHLAKTERQMATGPNAGAEIKAHGATTKSAYEADDKFVDALITSLTDQIRAKEEE